MVLVQETKHLRCSGRHCYRPTGIAADNYAHLRKIPEFVRLYNAELVADKLRS